MKRIDVLVRAIIRQKGKILVCKKKDKDYYFFPGGHLEFAESAKEALKREIFEELGLKILEANFIGATEHQFVEDGKKFHEINLIFQIKTDKITTKSKEGHLQFFLFNRKQLAKEKVLPEILKKSVLEWLKNKKRFWKSQ